MQQRQLRLGDILDDYCPRERRVTNHAVVAMVGADVKQTRCTTCDAEHEYKHAKVPRQRRKAESPAALYSQVIANAPKRVAHEEAGNNGQNPSLPATAAAEKAHTEAEDDDAPAAAHGEAAEIGESPDGQESPGGIDEPLGIGADEPIAAAEADAAHGDANDLESQSR